MNPIILILLCGGCAIQPPHIPDNIIVRDDVVRSAVYHTKKSQPISLDTLSYCVASGIKDDGRRLGKHAIKSTDERRGTLVARGSVSVGSYSYTTGRPIAFEMQAMAKLDGAQFEFTIRDAPDMHSGALPDDFNFALMRVAGDIESCLTFMTTPYSPPRYQYIPPLHPALRNPYRYNRYYRYRGYDPYRRW